MNKPQASRELLVMMADCLEPNWDGYGAEPLEIYLIQLGAWFIDSLPDDIENPYFAPEPNGCLGIGWLKGSAKEGEGPRIDVVISVSTGLQFANYMATTDGKVIFKGHIPDASFGIPEQLINFLRSNFPAYKINNELTEFYGPSDSPF